MTATVLPDGGTDPVLLETGDTIVLAEGTSYQGSLYTPLRGGISQPDPIGASDISVTLLGTFAETDPGSQGLFLITLVGADGGNTLTIGETAYVEADAITVEGPGSNFENYGLLVQQESFDDSLYVAVGGDGSSFLNAGTITGSVWGVALSGSDFTGTNSGEISGLSTGVSLSYFTGTFENSGVIKGGYSGIDDNGIYVTNSPLSIPGHVDLVNTGIVAGMDEGTSSDQQAFSINFTQSTANIVNEGMLIGDVKLSDGNDVFNSRDGMLDGDVLLGGGNDIATGSRDGETIYGQGGADRINGHGGGDTIFGGSQRDLLKGGGGNDELFGGSGSDRLHGGKGNDRLDGGTGNDIMAGGRGADVFVFGVEGGHQVITDFTNGDDKIDLSAFGLVGFGDLTEAISFGRTEYVIDLSEFGGEGTVSIERHDGFTGLSESDFIF